MPRLTDDARRARGIRGSEDGADIVGILNSVQDDDQGWSGAIGNQIFERDAGGIADLGHHALMHAAATRAFELRRRNAFHSDASAPGSVDHLAEPAGAALADAQRRRTPRAERFEHGINAVNEQGSKGLESR